MADEEDTQNKDSGESAQQSQMRVNIKMQQGEHTGQPIYSNFTAVQPGQGVLFVDFGFLDPQTINALNRMAQSGEQAQTVNARMSCRMAISLEAASQLTRQLNQLLQITQRTQVQQQSEQHGAASDKEIASVDESSSVAVSEKTANEKEKSKAKKGFRFPWSSSDKTH